MMRRADPVARRVRLTKCDAIVSVLAALSFVP
jgi:hypothetical protein